MNLFSQIHSLQLLTFYKNDQELGVIIGWCSLDVFFDNIIKINHFLYCFIILILSVFSFFHIRSLLIPCVYVSIESVDCNLLSAFKLNAILLIYSVKRVCLSLLNLLKLLNIFYEFFLIFFKTICINIFPF